MSVPAQSQGIAESIKATFDGIAGIFTQVSHHGTQTLVISAGFVVLAVGFLIALWSAPRQGVKNSIVAVAVMLIALVCIIGASLDIGRKHGYSLVTSPAPDPPACLTPKQSFENLLSNAQVMRVIRLVAYAPPEAGKLSIARLQSLGQPHQQFVFVADYDELKGCAVVDAISKIGGKCREGQRVSAIVFPLGERDLFPANARGILQLVQQIDQQPPAMANYKSADLAARLSADALDALSNRDLESYAWKGYSRFFTAYTDTVKMIEGECSAFEFIGSLDRDWHSLGYAQVMGRPSLQGHDFSLELDGKPIEIKDYGARVFLIENAKLSELQGQCLLDFELPMQQHIPILD